MRHVGGLIFAVLALFAVPARAQVTCTSAATQSGILNPGAYLYIESTQHNLEVAGAPLIERYQWRVYNAATGNPDTGPFLMDVPLARAVFTPVAGVPNCYRTTPSPSGLPPNALLKSVVIVHGRAGFGSAPRSEPSNDFLQPLLLAVGAVRVG